MGIHTLPQPVVPSATTIAEVCPDHLQYSQVQSAVEIQFRDIAFANDVTMSCLFLVIISADADGARSRSSTATEKGWALSSLTRFWHTVATDGVPLSSNRISLRCVVLFLRAIRTVVSHMAGVKSRSALVSRIMILSSQALSTLLVTQPPLVDLTIGRQLCITLFELALLSRESRLSHQNFLEHMIPRLHGAKENQTHSFDLGQDLEVWFEI